MAIMSFSLFMIMMSTSLLSLASSLPFQAMALLMMSLAVASFIGNAVSPLLGIYMILIYSSGLLVLLAYFIALSPNQKLNSPSLFIMTIIISIIMLTLTQTVMYSMSMKTFSFSLMSSSIITILNPSSAVLLTLISVILIITMISVVKILSVSNKPMRPWNSM